VLEAYSNIYTAQHGGTELSDKLCKRCNSLGALEHYSREEFNDGDTEGERLAAKFTPNANKQQAAWNDSLQLTAVRLDGRREPGRDEQESSGLIERRF
jgi:hypothetical protein